MVADIKQIPVQSLSETEQEPVHFRLEELLVKEREGQAELHRHNYCELLLFREGGGSHMIDFESYPILPHSLHWVGPGQVHRLSRARHVTGYVLLFSREFLHLGLEQAAELTACLSNACARMPLPPALFEELHQLAKQMQAEEQSGKILQTEVLRAYLQVFLLKVKRWQQPEIAEAADPAKVLVRRFQELLEQHFRQWRLVKDYADALCVSEKTLQLAVKKKLGSTAGELVQVRIVLEAKRLLIHSGLTNKEIAFHLSFDDPSHFSKFFRRCCGSSPSAFQQQYSGMYQLSS